ncbi:GFA family protein [Sphingosinicella sp. CPCC 101087]|uniref:GFA family protein n=1 Tax=Sphingosinicella sp. CPCC 101087 TaxID=2497754 RepID=UPI001FB0A5B3|nr:GFA family protein [Sphingosinicella sp. CPCC 101087]
MTQNITGGCLCGACRYRAAAEPINIRACHCRLCQKATGAPFYARVLVTTDSVEIQGPVGWHASSPGIRRGFCTRCGTSLFSERASAGVIGLTHGGLDDPDAFPPAEHIWVSSKQAWVVPGDGLPQYSEGAPA